MNRNVDDARSGGH